MAPEPFYSFDSREKSKKILKTILAFLLFVTLTLSMVAVQAATAGPNVEIAGEAAPDRQRVEPTIAVDPRDPSIIVAGAQDLRLLPTGGHRWHGYYRSTDGGQSWSSSLLPGFPGDTSPEGLSSPLHGFKATSDPVLAFDRTGNVYFVGITTRLSLFVAKYVNDGADYSFATLICPFFCADKPWIAIDTSGGPNDGNVYVSFDGAGGLSFVRSTDGGHTFSPISIAIKNGQLSGEAVDPQGRLFVSAVGRVATNGITNLQVAVSTDGGLDFSGHEAVATLTFLPSPLPGNRFRTGTVPQIAADSSGVYVVYDDFTAGNSNVMLAKSTDGGITWTTPTMVNDVTTGQHFFSSIAVSAGVISVAWYDSRLGQLSNGTITGLNVFYASSTNAGSSFSSNIRVTSVSFNPNTVERTDFGDTSIFMGDYIQIAASSTSAHPVWADNRNACDVVDPTFGCVDQDIFTATITY